MSNAIPLNDLLRRTGLEPVAGGDGCLISSVTQDSRRVRPGSLFVAIPGNARDGLEFVEEALRRGAVAVAAPIPVGLDVPTIVLPDGRRSAALLAAASYGNPASSLDVYAVTGTNGKTSTCYFFEAILKEAGRRPGLVSTVTNRVGGEERSSHMTTPPPEDLHRYFAQMARSGLDCAVVEASSHALDQDRLAGIELAHAAITNITREHLDYHRDLFSYREAKARLPGLVREGGAFVMNLDDPHVAYFADRCPQGVRFTGFTSRDRRDAALTARLEGMTLDGMTMALRAGDRSARLTTGLTGLHNKDNLLTAACLALLAGIDLATIVRALGRVEAPPGRLEEVPVHAGFRVFVDYAHTPDALEKVMGALRSVAPRRLLLVFGCGGEKDRGKRPAMGRIAECLADRVLITDDNPRGERPEAITDEIRAGVSQPGAMPYVSDRKEAIEIMLSEARPGDVVLIAGKGHEGEQIIQGRRIPHDDRAVVRAWRDERERSIERAT